MAYLVLQKLPSIAIGTDRTFQRGDHGLYGVAYKYVPMYTDRKGSYEGCWTVSGSKNKPVIPQVITPNITWFKVNSVSFMISIKERYLQYHSQETFLLYFNCVHIISEVYKVLLQFLFATSKTEPDI